MLGKLGTATNGGPVLFGWRVRDFHLVAGTDQRHWNAQCQYRVCPLVISFTKIFPSSAPRRKGIIAMAIFLLDPAVAAVNEKLSALVFTNLPALIYNLAICSEMCTGPLGTALLDVPTAVRIRHNMM